VKLDEKGKRGWRMKKALLVLLVIASYHRVDGKPSYKTIIPMMEQKGFRSKYKDISYFAK